MLTTTKLCISAADSLACLSLSVALLPVLAAMLHHHNVAAVAGEARPTCNLDDLWQTRNSEVKGPTCCRWLGCIHLLSGFKNVDALQLELPPLRQARVQGYNARHADLHSRSTDCQTRTVLKVTLEQCSTMGASSKAAAALACQSPHTSRSASHLQ